MFPNLWDEIRCVSVRSLEPSLIRAELERVLNSPVFCQSARLRRFLSYVVECAINGQSGDIKEYTVALEVFDRTADFDPRLDPIVRVEGGRLRQKLARYYESLGAGNPIRIELPKGSYAPVFTSRPPRATQASPYRLYLKGRHFWQLRTEDGIRQAIRLYEQALTLDAGYALAWAGLADACSLLGNYGAVPRSEVHQQAMEAANRAVSLAPDLAEAHTSLAHVLATYRQDWEESEREFELAIDLNPYFATAHHWYAITCLMPQRRLEEAAVEIAEARKLDPSSVSVQRDAGIVQWCRRDAPGALELARQTIQLDPAFHEAYWLLGLAQEQAGDYAAASESFEAGANILATPRLLGALGHSLARAGNRRRARSILSELGSASGYVSPFNLALIHTGLKDTEHAFSQLRRGLAQRCYEMVWIRVDPRLDPLRTEPPFTGLLR